MENKELSKALKMAIKANKLYWCTYCKTHVTEGHTEKCKLVQTSIEFFGKKWTKDNVQVIEWDN